MRRAVVTGLGIISCLGNDKQTVTQSLRESNSGIRYREDFAEMGLKCNVGAVLDIDPRDHIDRKILRFMGPSASRLHGHGACYSGCGINRRYGLKSENRPCHGFWRGFW